MHAVAVGVLTLSTDSPRWKALQQTWLSQIKMLMVVESHTDVSRVQQIWKYIPQRLYEKFPSADFYLIIDDDVFVNLQLLNVYLKHRDPKAAALYGPGFCNWGVKRQLRKRASKLLGIPMPDLIHMVIGGIMLFTAAAVRRFTDPTLLMRCIDDLETLYSNEVFLWGGLKSSALYNQDWLFCWCLQVRMGGSVVVDNAFEDVDFPADRCISLADAAQRRVGVHHANPRRMRSLWRAYQRGVAANRSLPQGDPSQPGECELDAYGEPSQKHDLSDHTYLDTFRRPNSSVWRDGRCRSIVNSKALQKKFPLCIAHMAHTKQHPETSPCWGGLGRAQCAGFQLDTNDNCNLQYYVFCERFLKGGIKESWCPSPQGYPDHCCYVSAIKQSEGRQRKLAPRQYLLQVFPDTPVFAEGEGRTVPPVKLKQGGGKRGRKKLKKKKKEKKP